MSSKSQILEALGESSSPTIEPSSFYQYIDHIRFENPLETFVESAKRAGAKIFFQHPSTFQSIFKDTKMIVDTTLQNSKIELNNIQNVSLTILKGEFGVAENGAVWINWRDDLFPRALLTLSKNLAIYLDRNSIVDNMAQAYDLIDLTQTSYGIFLSGPSKTADIEQSLVIGAHGAVDVGIFFV